MLDSVNASAVSGWGQWVPFEWQRWGELEYRETECSAVVVYHEWARMGTNGHEWMIGCAPWFLGFEIFVFIREI